MDKVKRYIPYLLLTGLTLFFCRIFVGKGRLAQSA